MLACRLARRRRLITSAGNTCRPAAIPSLGWPASSLSPSSSVLALLWNFASTSSWSTSQPAGWQAGMLSSTDPAESASKTWTLPLASVDLASFLEWENFVLVSRRGWKLKKLTRKSSKIENNSYLCGGHK